MLFFFFFFHEQSENALQVVAICETGSLFPLFRDM